MGDKGRVKEIWKVCDGMIDCEVYLVASEINIFDLRKRTFSPILISTTFRIHNSTTNPP